MSSSGIYIPEKMICCRETVMLVSLQSKLQLLLFRQEFWMASRMANTEATVLALRDTNGHLLVQESNFTNTLFKASLAGSSGCLSLNFAAPAMLQHSKRGPAAPLSVTELRPPHQLGSSDSSHAGV